jgi:hypothetical protein
MFDGSSGSHKLQLKRAAPIAPECQRPRPEFAWGNFAPRMRHAVSRRAGGVARRGRAFAPPSLGDTPVRGWRTSCLIKLPDPRPVAAHCPPAVRPASGQAAPARDNPGKASPEVLYNVVGTGSGHDRAAFGRWSMRWQATLAGPRPT